MTTAEEEGALSGLSSVRLILRGLALELKQARRGADRGIHDGQYEQSQ